MLGVKEHRGFIHFFANDHEKFPSIWETIPELNSRHFYNFRHACLLPYCGIEFLNRLVDFVDFLEFNLSQSLRWTWYLLPELSVSLCIYCHQFYREEENSSKSCPYHTGIRRDDHIFPSRSHSLGILKSTKVSSYDSWFDNSFDYWYVRFHFIVLHFSFPGIVAR
jgi:hypothetical protein